MGLVCAVGLFLQLPNFAIIPDHRPRDCGTVLFFHNYKRLLLALTFSHTH